MPRSAHVRDGGILSGRNADGSWPGEPENRKVYRLYIWRTFNPTCVDPSFGFRSVMWHKRGRCIGTFRRYKDLVANAQRRAVAAGYPKSRWMDLFDWNV